MAVDYPTLQSYLEALVPARHPELLRMEDEAKQANFPIFGPTSCQACYMMARMIGARKVFELGSGFGYSTAWFARAVDENGGGTVYHTVWDEDLSNRAKQHLSALGFPEAGSGAKTEIDYTMGEAIAALRATDGPFDLVFNDIDKDAYPETVDVVLSKLRPGGLFITDNVIWSGRVLEPNPDETTKSILKFTELMTRNPAWDCSILPIRDGILVARKK